MSHLTAESTAVGLLSPSHGQRVEKAVALQGVTVVVPLYNERECTELMMSSLAQLEHALGRRFDFEFLLVDDGSTDDTVALLSKAIAGRPNYRLVEHGENRGIAAAIHTGIRAASHDVAVSIDCDGSYDPLLIGELVPKLTPGVDMVTASPYHRDGGVVNVPAWRLRLSRLASQLYGLLCRHKFSCYTSCFRAYRRDAVAAVELENHRFVGVAELMWKVLERGGRVVEHPAKLRSRMAGHSKMRVIRASLGHLGLMIRIAYSRLRRKI
jgi:glycosyltransferase involved in cell wall biosynthesis